MNDQDCHILINGSQTGIFIRANQGFEVDINEVPITSFKVVEAGITYNWVGHF